MRKLIVIAFTLFVIQQHGAHCFQWPFELENNSIEDDEGLLSLVKEENSKENRSFVIDYANDCFRKDGKPFRYVSGSIHYFRVPKVLWVDRLTKLRKAGFNTVQTYVEWSTHEPNPGEFNVTDIIDYVKTAQQVGLLVILRPGPFIDAERDMGGLPWWLLQKDPNMKLRSSDQSFKFYVDRWFSVLLPPLRDLLYVNGGPIISVQVENEYGSYGCDKPYLRWLRDTIKAYLHDDVVLFSTDGPSTHNLNCSKIDGVYATVDFGTGGSPQGPFHIQRQFEPHGPLVNSEFYPGWLDHWGQPHAYVSDEAVADMLDKILALNASVNMYMFHGGTSFGYKAGSNYDSSGFWPNPTSYDYDAPLNEAGDPTTKLVAIQKVIEKYYPGSTSPVNPSYKMYIGPIAMYKDHTLQEIIEMSTLKDTRKYPPTFEELGIDSGYVVYQTVIDVDPSDPSLLSVPGLADRAQVYSDDILVGELSRTRGIYSMPINLKRGSTLSLIVENQGRICWGPNINEQKGITQNVTLGPIVLENWEMHAQYRGVDLRFENNNLQHFYEKMMLGNQQMYNAKGIGQYFGVFSTYGEVHDTFLLLHGWTKGTAYLNGFNLGRYWPVEGPQITLYAPAHLFNQGMNLIVLLETESAPCGLDPASCQVSFVDEPVLNGTVPFNNAQRVDLSRHHPRSAACVEHFKPYLSRESYRRCDFD